ncbi:hypothetical protein AVEN_268312-1 [Araneus ventricosus]|uniref:Uncharacterized protein n=1 Tax=Araneus ventricosus TaxID=182803 RepID=A0A4Y2VCZ2_ARAVE|nr:hypothetical protein AVEN_268312-1 [Araneus ventricosus]
MSLSDPSTPRSVLGTYPHKHVEATYELPQKNTNSSSFHKEEVGLGSIFQKRTLRPGRLLPESRVCNDPIGRLQRHPLLLNILP